MAKTRSEAQKEAEKKYNAKREKRYRAWMMIVYPGDSLPEDYRDIISDLHLKVWLSPEHKDDVWTKADERKNPKHKAGEKKKNHRHLIVEYPSPVTRSDFEQDFADLHGTDGQRVRDIIAMVRYLIHKDDPGKAQYDPEDIECYGGADLAPLETMGTCERHEALRAMRKFIREHNFLYYCDFYDYCDDCMTLWAYLLDDSCSYTIERYIKSYAHKMLSGQ